MKDGLKIRLFNFITQYESVTYQAIVDKSVEWGYKSETSFRRLRELTTKTHNHIPLIEEILSPKKAIIGYRYIRNNIQSFDLPVQPLVTKKPEFTGYNY